jgi:hypothetical protein
MYYRGAVASGGILVTALLIAWNLSPNAAAGPCVIAAGPAALPEIPEASSLAVSRRDPSILWSHNDSGNDAVRA